MVEIIGNLHTGEAEARGSWVGNQPVQDLVPVRRNKLSSSKVVLHFISKIIFLVLMSIIDLKHCY